MSVAFKRTSRHYPNSFIKALNDNVKAALCINKTTQLRSVTFERKTLKNFWYFDFNKTSLGLNM